MIMLYSLNKAFVTVCSLYMLLVVYAVIGYSSVLYVAVNSATIRENISEISKECITAMNMISTRKRLLPFTLSSAVFWIITLNGRHEFQL